MEFYAGDGEVAILRRQGNSASTDAQLIEKLSRLSQEWTGDWAPLLSFSTNAALREYGVQLPRNPLPLTGQLFDDAFLCALQKAHEENPAIHDGITALVRQTEERNYCVAGWSYWFLPRFDRLPTLSGDNKGTAHHTCAVLSSTGDFDLLCRLSRNLVEIFADGALTVYNG